MPFYEYKCSDCEHEFKQLNKIDNRKVPETEPCPQCKKEGTVSLMIAGAPGLSDPIRLGVRKVDSGFKEVLQKIHNGVAGSTLNKSRALD